MRIVSTGHEKSNFTVVLSVTAAGEKLKQMIIFKKKRIPKDNFPPGVIAEQMIKGHLTEDVLELFKEHSRIAVIPGGMTKYLQPLDVGINKPFKDNLRAGWERWMADSARARYTTGGARKRMTYGESACSSAVVRPTSFYSRIRKIASKDCTKMRDALPGDSATGLEWEGIIGL
ncbi:unnamed protein product [Cylicocyclus nassatus]|uniref:DDE-1 domain-containing protein n=1 Tax=Cylicocyclus nassatus TaxID=53992 RepID=A0AA36M1K8_CYLNA|nr:unnamed protein product [Cylicocyclus nassatus]